MPEVTAVKSNPVKSEQPINNVVDLEAYKAEKLKAISAHLGEALGTRVTEQSIQPATERYPMPDYIPTKGTVNKSHEGGIPDLPDSHQDFSTPLSPLGELSDHLAFANRLVTDDHGKVVDKASRFTQHIAEKEQKAMAETNKPKQDTRAPLKKFVDWLHDEPDDSNVIHAEDRFGAKKEKAA